jgi:hypothetical protein
MELDRCGTYGVVTLLLLIVSTGSPVKAVAGTTTQQSDPSAITWATQAMAALTGGVIPSGVNLQATVSRVLGGQQETGSMTLQSSGISNSQISAMFGSATWSENRTLGANGPGGQWIDVSGTTRKLAQHNCWTDAAWFFPAFSLLSSSSDASLVFSDLGQEQRSGATVEHLRVYRTASTLPATPARTLALMSITDYYLDSQTALPVATVFFAHPDNDTTVNIPVEITYSGYQRVSQSMVPFQITKYHNGTQLFQISVTKAQVQ